MKYGKTAAYTICKNEIKHLKTWLMYARSCFDYRVILDTGSSDGTWELLQEEAKTDPNLIIEQKVFTPWIFNIARNYNLDMIPKDTTVAIQADMDEWYSVNVIDKIEQVYQTNPDWDSIACARLDIYSKEVFVGQPNHIGTNKIHRLFNPDGTYRYKWQYKIYECIGFQPTNRSENEIYLNDLFLIHNQDFNKPERSPLYKQMLIDAHITEPEESWYSWFLCNLYYRERDLDNFIPVACKFVQFNKQRDSKYHEVRNELNNIYKYHPDCPLHLKDMIKTIL